MKTLFTVLISAIVMLTAATAGAQSIAMVDTKKLMAEEPKAAATAISNINMKQVSHGYLLSWEATNQFNVAWFELQLSDDNNHFSTVKRRTCGTQKHSKYEVHLTNTLIFANPVYYRLKIVSLDGTVSYTETRVTSGE